MIKEYFLLNNIDYNLYRPIKENTQNEPIETQNQTFNKPQKKKATNKQEITSTPPIHKNVRNEKNNSEPPPRV